MQKGDFTVIFKTKGMNASGRARKLRLDLGKLEGIRVFDINYITDTVSIKYDAKKLTPDAIKNAIDGHSA